jgi:hypothetical protein
LKGGYEEMKRTLGRFFPGVILLALVSILSPTNAYASVIASSGSPTQSITSVTFKVAPETTTGGIATGTISFTAGANNAVTRFFYVNTGTVNILSFTRTITQTVAAGGFTLNACPVNTTFSSNTTCSDASTPTTITLTGTGPALTVGQWSPIQLIVTKKNDAFTFASTVSGSQIRAGTNTAA